MHALAAFEAAARLDSFARAADELCVTQSAVSHRIRQLEEHLGVRLFLRVHKHVLLTPHGERFLVGVREAMQQLAAAAAGVAEQRPARRLRVTCAPALASQILIPRLKSYLDRSDPLDIEIDTSTRMAELADEGFDLALRLGRAPWPGYEAELIAEERVVACCSPDYAARFGNVRHAGMLERATLIHGKPFSWAQWTRRVSGRPIALPPSSGLVFQEVWAAIDAATHGLGVVLSNQVSALEARRAGRLVPFVAESVDLQRHYYGVYRADSARLDAIRHFLDWFGPLVRDELSAIATS